MKKLAVTLGIISALALFASPASAVPPSGAFSAVAGAASKNSMVEHVRRCVYRGRVYNVPGSCDGKCVTSAWRGGGSHWIRWHYC